jgi:hypothetical protein
MPIYLVEWAIDIEADNPREAAKVARQYQVKPDTSALVFTVKEHDSDGIPAVIDLLLDDPNLEREPDPGSDNPDCVHEWAYTGTAYGGDDDRWMGEGRAYCINCGANGDA